LCRAILEERRHPEQGYRSGLGLIRLGRRYDKARIEAACERAFCAGARLRTEQTCRQSLTTRNQDASAGVAMTDRSKAITSL
jgi:hypothetical protein